jgi:hypothetical protein
MFIAGTIHFSTSSQSKQFTAKKEGHPPQEQFTTNFSSLSTANNSPQKKKRKFTTEQFTTSLLHQSMF